MTSNWANHNHQPIQARAHIEFTSYAEVVLAQADLSHQQQSVLQTELVRDRQSDPVYAQAALGGKSRVDGASG